ncbi:hypothetical protein NPIL_165491 [Nephila pilipes]|uniref:Uncharacterized protein n=1 Tax=Nephila pilipes TaxID=299642 RepID=A0A8X6U2F0_NEPPI|nr:hypothetical protein NPIL_165491 [Nephila pilipes]
MRFVKLRIIILFGPKIALFFFIAAAVTKLNCVLIPPFKHKSKFPSQGTIREPHKSVSSTQMVPLPHFVLFLHDGLLYRLQRFSEEATDFCNDSTLAC